MLRFPISPVVRPGLRFLGNTVFVGVIGVALVECSGSGGSVENENAAIGIQTSQMSILIENKVGMPLVDVDVAILPVGGGTEFKKFAGRMENAAKREFALGEFYGRDGTTFSLRVVRPRTVRVTAKDLNNKAYNVQVPWK